MISKGREGKGAPASTACRAIWGCEEDAASLKEANRLRLEGKSDEARPLLIDLIDRCRNGGNVSSLGFALAKLGQIQRDMGEQAEALESYREAAEISRSEGDQFNLAHRLRHIGDVHKDRGELNLAEDAYDEALSIYRKLREVLVLDLANALRAFAILKDKQGSEDAAVKLWSEAKALYGEAGIVAGVQEATTRISQSGPPDT